MNDDVSVGCTIDSNRETKFRAEISVEFTRAKWNRYAAIRTRSSFRFQLSLSSSLVGAVNRRSARARELRRSARLPRGNAFLAAWKKKELPAETR